MTRLGQQAKHYLTWAPILRRAAEIVREVEAATGITLTLRKLFYKLVAALLIPNDMSSYKGLSRKTGVARKDGTFPDLDEDKVAIEEPFYFDDVKDALDWLRNNHVIDRSKTQKYNLLIACEKKGTVPFLKLWFMQERHIRIVPLGGESSITTWQKVKRYIDRDGRPVIVFYLGDFDSSGYGIRTRFKANLGLTDDQFVHVALTTEQVDRYLLPRNPGKEKASRKDREAFRDEVGEDVQVEVDALDEAVLRELLEIAIAPYWDERAYQRQLKEEQKQRRQIARLLRGRR